MHRIIKAEEVNESAVRLIGSDWMLITAGTADHYNTMTAAWGGIGFLWRKPVVYTFIRPTRHTYGFAESNDLFTLSFFDESFKEALQLCGTRSGRDTDKAALTGLKPLQHKLGTVFFEQARLVMVCRKLYTHDIDPARFLDPGIDKNYPAKDYHRMYIGEIIETLTTDPA